MCFEDAKLRVKWTIETLQRNFPVDRFQGAKVLDIGCGTGSGVVAALKFGAQLAVGIDRDANEFGYSFFPEIAAEFGVNVNSALLIEANVFNTTFFDGGFDIVMMYDSIEHVPDPEAFIQYCGKALRPGGMALVSTCPLYYSPVGHHLWQHFPEDTMPWAHLYFDWEKRLADARVPDWGLQRFRELNRVTRSELLTFIHANGLSVVSDTSILHNRFPPLLEQYGHLIDMSKVPSKDDLLCDFVCLVFAKF